MKKEKVISIILKIITILIVIIGIWCFFDYRLYKIPQTNLQVYLRIFLPILVLGFSGTLYGIATLLDKEE